MKIQSLQKIVVFIVVILFYNSSFSQQAYEDLKIKEHYDFIHSNELISGQVGIINKILIDNPFSGYGYGENLGPALESYINMYTTTKDKAYLIKFINLSLRAMAWRNTDYLFTANGQYLYMNGHLTYPMSHFVHLVYKEYPPLISTVISEDLIDETITSTISANLMPNQSSYTYGGIADWLLHRNVETLDYMINNYWGGDNYGFLIGDSPMQINMQSPLGASLLYYGDLVSSYYPGLQSYLDKGAAIARLYRSNVSYIDGCYPKIYNEPVLQTQSSTYSTWWYHTGWRIETYSCFLNVIPSYSKSTEFIEDISHAIPTLFLPHVAHQINLYTYGSYPFGGIGGYGTTEMVKFRNMFTNHIYDQNGQFYNNVFGTDNKLPEGIKPHNYYRSSAISYMPLYKFDNVPGTAGPLVYNIVMNNYISAYYSSPGNISNGQQYTGLSHTVKAQWDKECVDLTLYNRKVVYNQDFFVKNNLVVDPITTDNFYSTNHKSFADPVITNSVFIVQGGTNPVTVKMTAGNSIILKPGVTIEAGSNFNAYIDESLCVNGQRLSNDVIPTLNNDDSILATNKSLLNNSDLEDISIYPNPTEGTFIVDMKNHTIEKIEIVNTLGTIVLSQNTESKKVISLDISVFPIGIYYVRLISGKDIKMEKIIKN